MKRKPQCDRCMLCEQQEPHFNRCVWGWGNPNADLMLIGEAPGLSEARRGIPFCGQAGNLLDHILTHLSLSREDMYITNVIKCRPADNKLPGKKDLEVCFDRCWPFLLTEIQDVDPKAILLMGGTALSLMAAENQITKWEGMEVESVYEGARTFASLHPAYVLRQPSKEFRLAQAIARAARAAGLKVKTKTQVDRRYPYEVRD